MTEDDPSQRHFLAQACNLLGVLYNKMGDFAQAVKYFDQNFILACELAPKTAATSNLDANSHQEIPSTSNLKKSQPSIKPNQQQTHRGSKAVLGPISNSKPKIYDSSTKINESYTTSTATGKRSDSISMASSSNPEIPRTDHINSHHPHQPLKNRVASEKDMNKIKSDTNPIETATTHDTEIASNKTTALSSPANLNNNANNVAVAQIQLGLSRGNAFMTHFFSFVVDAKDGGRDKLSPLLRWKEKRDFGVPLALETNPSTLSTPEQQSGVAGISTPDTIPTANESHDDAIVAGDGAQRTGSLDTLKENSDSTGGNSTEESSKNSEENIS